MVRISANPRTMVTLRYLMSWFLDKGRTTNPYLGTLSRDETAADLRRLFEPFGKANAVNVIKGKSSGVSKGFGLLETPAREEAAAASTDLYRQPFRRKLMAISRIPPPAQGSKTAMVNLDGDDSRRSR